MDKNSFKDLTYFDKEPNVKSLRGAYASTVLELEPYFHLCRQSYDDRRNEWAGKSEDLRKHGANAFPWDGASDMEANTIEERIGRLVALMISSLNRSNVRAFPVEGGDMARAKVVSSFLKWMVSSGYIKRFKREMELGANYLLERGLLMTYVGWQSEDRRYLQEFSLDEIAQMDEQIAEAVVSGDQDEELIARLQQQFKGVTTKRGKKALKDLRKVGVAQLPIIRRQVDAPMVKTLAPDGDFFFPDYCTDPQRAPYCFWRTYFTAQELENKILTDGWDEDFVDYVIQKHRGVDFAKVDSSSEYNRNSYASSGDNDLIELVYGYQRLIDEEDGAEGIYCTVFHNGFDGNDQVQGYAKFELLNGYEDYPVVVTKLSEDSNRMYDVDTIPRILRGIQNTVKVERDSRCDRNSMSTLPPLLHPVGQAPSDWGPGRFIPYRRKGDFEFGPTPDFNAGSVELEQNLLDQADKLVGLDEGSQISQIRKQFLVDKFLQHSAEVVAMCYRCFQRFGPDQMFFRVTGVADPQQFEKGNPDENFDIMVSYDTLNNDPDTQEKKLQQIVSLMQLDRNGRINVDSLIDVLAGAIDPVLADGILQPVEQAQEQITRQVTDDLAKIYAGIEMPARPNGGQIALQVIEQYMQQQDIMQRFQSDESFKERIEKYAGQYQFAMQQMQNAQIGRLGTAPAQMGGMETQGMGQQ